VYHTEHFAPSAGSYRILVAAGNWSSGIYWVRLGYSGAEVSTKIVYLK